MSTYLPPRGPYPNFRPKNYFNNDLELTKILSRKPSSVTQITQMSEVVKERHLTNKTYFNYNNTP